MLVLITPPLWPIIPSLFSSVLPFVFTTSSLFSLSYSSPIAAPYFSLLLLILDSFFGKFSALVNVSSLKSFYFEISRVFIYFSIQISSVFFSSSFQNIWFIFGACCSHCINASSKVMYFYVFRKWASFFIYFCYDIFSFPIIYSNGICIYSHSSPLFHLSCLIFLHSSLFSANFLPFHAPHFHPPLVTLFFTHLPRFVILLNGLVTVVPFPTLNSF